jgi:hypothetical protein
MKRNYSLLRIAFVFAVGFAFLLPASAPAPTVALTIQGVFISSGIPTQVHGRAELTISSQTPDGEFQGVLTMLGNTYTVTGEMDASGNFEFSSGRGRTGVRGEGKWQDLTRGGALLQATYRLSSGDKGEIKLLRNFTQPREPEMPPDIAGSWGGPYESSLSLMRGTVQWNVQQDRTPSGAPGTGFTGEETVEGGTPAVQLYKFAGTIDDQGNFVRIGVSDQGFVIEGGKFESGQLTAHSMRHFGEHTSDDLVYVITRF